MKYTRLIYMSGIVLMLLSACSDSSSLDAEGQNGKPLQQTFTVAVESVGELFEGGEGVNPATVASRRPISSVTPTQTFDKLSILIVEYQSPAKVVYKKTIETGVIRITKQAIPGVRKTDRDDMSQLHLPAVSVWRKERITWHM